MRFTVFYAHNMPMPFGEAPAEVKASAYKEVTSVDTENLESLFRAMNVVDGTELPIQLRVRSMSVGDVAVDAEGNAHYCASFGWQPVTFLR